MIALGEWLSCDTETTGLLLHHGDKPYYVSTCTEHGIVKSWSWDVDPLTREPIIDPDDVRAIKAYFKGKRIIFFNAKFDLRALLRIGIDVVKIIGWDNIHDAHLASHVLNSNGTHKLKDLCLLNPRIDISDDDQRELKKIVKLAHQIMRRYNKKHPDKAWKIAGKGVWPQIMRAPKDGWAMADGWLPAAMLKHNLVPRELRAKWEKALSLYGDQDAIRTISLFLCQLWEMESKGLTEQYEWRRKLLEPFFAAEERGVHVHIDRIREMQAEFKPEAELRKQEALEVSGIYKLSAAQVRQYLFKKHKIKPVLYTDDGKPSTKTEVLNELETNDPKVKEFIKKLIEHRKCLKVYEHLESYARKEIDGQLHPSFNIAGTDTLRGSSSDPNAQNIPTKGRFSTRNCFGPAPGRAWISQDYKNIEMRIFAYKCGDQRLIDAFESGKSVHLIIAEEVYPQLFHELGPERFEKETVEYKYCKNGNFSLIYGAAEAKADRTYGVQGAYSTIRQKFPYIDSFMLSKHEEAVRWGYVTCFGGYRLNVPTSEPHKAVNYYVQGSANRVISDAMTWIYPRLPHDHYMIMNVHDELVFDVPRRVKSSFFDLIGEGMEMQGDKYGVHIPVDVDFITYPKGWS